MREIFGDREAALCRELTKKFEEVLRGTLGELVNRFEKVKPLGEIVLVVAGKGRKRVFE
jgi:16S rRNA (cytidine1402-2'-O)-methyltransferase